MHSSGIVHRDIKPENILIGESLHARVIDFGDACYIDPVLNEPFASQDPYEHAGDHEMYDMAGFSDDEEPQIESKPRGNSFVGSPHYVSPEMLSQCMAGPEADFWSLGCILFTILFGKVPFDGATEHLTFEKITSLDYKFPIDAFDD